MALPSSSFNSRLSAWPWMSKPSGPGVKNPAVGQRDQPAPFSER
jgi:hypothetical protein